jgi:hypothetical protein
MLCFFRASDHPVPSTSLSRCSSTDTTVPTHYTDALSVHSVLKTLRPNRLCWLHATVGWTGADPSVHPVLNFSSWRVSVLFKLDHRIVRRFPPKDRRFIRRCCLHGFSSPNHPTQLGKGPSVPLLENPPSRYVLVVTLSKSVSMSTRKDAFWHVFNNVLYSHDIRHAYVVNSLKSTFFNMVLKSSQNETVLDMLPSVTYH